MKALINNILVLIGFQSVRYVEETTTERVGSGEHDYELVGTGKMLKIYERNIFKKKLPF